MKIQGNIETLKNLPTPAAYFVLCVSSCMDGIQNGARNKEWRKTAQCLHATSERLVDVICLHLIRARLPKSKPEKLNRIFFIVHDGYYDE